MIHLMNELKQIMQAFVVYTGSAYTIIATYFSENGLNAAQDVVAILVGLATFFYTVAKILEIRQRMTIKKEQADDE